MTGNKQNGIVLQDRDQHLLQELAVMRVIDREQAKCVGGFGSTTRVNSRLLALTRVGLLRRFFIGSEAVGKKTLYTLSPKGAVFTGTSNQGLRRRRDELSVADIFVSHQLKINEIYCVLKYRPIPIPETKFVRWISFSEPLASGSQLIPDGYVEVATPRDFVAAFLEVDLGHESRSVAERAFRSDGVLRDSTLTVLVLGDASTANEPWQLGLYSFPVTNRVIEGKTATTRRQAELFSNIQRKCESIRRTSISPIFLGVKQAVADLRARGCKATSHCQLFIDSDLEENAELSIKDALNRAHNSKLVLPTPVDNQGLDISFCGLATTAGHIARTSGRETRRASPRDPGRDDRLRQVWRSLFKQPELVKFEPYTVRRRSRLWQCLRLCFSDAATQQFRRNIKDSLISPEPV